MLDVFVPQIVLNGAGVVAVVRQLCSRSRGGACEMDGQTTVDSSRSGRGACGTLPPSWVPALAREYIRPPVGPSRSSFRKARSSGPRKGWTLAVPASPGSRGASRRRGPPDPSVAPPTPTPGVRGDRPRDHRRVPVAVAISPPRRFHQKVHLALGEVLATAALAVGRRFGGRRLGLSINDGWRGIGGVGFMRVLWGSEGSTVPRRA